MHAFPVSTQLKFNFLQIHWYTRTKNIGKHILEFPSITNSIKKNQSLPIKLTNVRPLSTSPQCSCRWAVYFYVVSCADVIVARHP